MEPDHQHDNKFEHLDLAMPGLKYTYDLGFKFESNTHGPVGYNGDPYLLLYASFAIDKPGRPRRTFHYALPRSKWREITAVSDEDRQALMDAAAIQIPLDLQAIEGGEAPPSLRGDREPMFL